MSITGFHRMDNKYADGYNAGYVAGVLAEKRAAEHVERIRITAAIRRAAKIARELDAAKIEYRNASDWMDAVCCEWRSYSVRAAIRAAIGSDKA